MHTWLSIGFPVCAVLTGGGLLLSWRIWRRAGARRGMRAAAWSLLPLAIYLVGAVTLVGRIGSEVVSFAGGFVLSSRSWAGVIMFGVAALILLASGGIPRPGGRRARRKKGLGQAAGGTAVPSASAGTAGAGSAAIGAGAARAGAAAPRAKVAAGKRGRSAKDTGAADDLSDPDLSDVEEILRRRGIK